MKALGTWFGIQLVLIAMKLCEVITWNWGTVLIPTWVTLGLVLGGICIAVIGAIFERHNDKMLFGE